MKIMKETLLLALTAATTTLSEEHQENLKRLIEAAEGNGSVWPLDLVCQENGIFNLYAVSIGDVRDSILMDPELRDAGDDMIYHVLQMISETALDHLNTEGVWAAIKDEIRERLAQPRP